MIKKAIFIFLLMTAALTVSYLFMGQIATYLIARVTNLDISYETTSPSLAYKNLRIIDRKSGMGIAAEDASFSIGMKKGLVVGFCLNSVHFVRHEKQDAQVSYDTLDSLVSAPFSSQWVYKKISGEIMPHRNGIKIRDLTAVSNDLRLSFNGDIGNDAIKSDIVIYFSDNVASKVPEELTRVVLDSEKDGWKSLSVSLAGNYRKPSIQVSSRRFRLNIKTIEQK